MSNQEHWTEEIYKSAQGRAMVNPPEDLFARIEKQLPPSNVVSIFRPRLTHVAAAVLFVLVNITAIASASSISGMETSVNESEEKIYTQSDFNYTI